jgi:glycogen debranching enzyme
VDGSCLERIVVRNYGDEPVDVSLTLALGADFRDIFEVRGLQRPSPGVILPAEVNAASITFSFRGLDEFVRRAHVKSSFLPTVDKESKVSLPIHLEANEELSFSMSITCESDGTRQESERYEESLARIGKQRASPLASLDIYTSNEQLMTG